MSESAWARLTDAVQRDPAVVGLVLTGARGKGVWTDHSDFDGLLVVEDAAVEAWRSRDLGDLDLTVLGATAFETYAEPFTPIAWRGYDFARLTAVVDRGGFQAALDRKGRLAPAAAETIAEEAIGGALNQLYRAAKSHRDGSVRAVRLDLLEFVPYLLTSLFALEGRHRPYNKLLAWDLGEEPLRAVDTPTLLTDVDAVAIHSGPRRGLAPRGGPPGVRRGRRRHARARGLGGPPRGRPADPPVRLTEAGRAGPALRGRTRTAGSRARAADPRPPPNP